MSERSHEANIRDIAQDIRDSLSDDFIEDIESDSLFIQIGDQAFELKPTGKSSDIEDLVKKEMKEKISGKLREMGRNIADKLQEMSQAIQQYKTELNNKIAEYETKISNTTNMPEVNLDHARMGLSIVKGIRPGNIVYLVRGLYWPKTVMYSNDGSEKERKIKSNLSRRMMTPVVFYIEVDKHNRVIEVSTRKLGNLEYFPHYHQQDGDGDCWGTWDYPKNCSSPIDAIQIARKAEKVLENINTYSTTSENPKGLPSLETIHKNIDDDAESPSVTARIRRTGLDAAREETREPVWEI